MADFELGERLEYWDGQRWVLCRRSFNDNVRPAADGGWGALVEVDPTAAARVPREGDE